MSLISAFYLNERLNYTSQSTEIHKVNSRKLHVQWKSPIVKCNRRGEKYVLEPHFWLWNIIWSWLLIKQFCLQYVDSIKSAVNANLSHPYSLNKFKLLPLLCGQQSKLLLHKHVKGRHYNLLLSESNMSSQIQLTQQKLITNKSKTQPRYFYS